MSDVKQLLKFQRSHDGGQELIEADEQAAAAKDFKDLIVDVQIAHADNIQQKGQYLSEHELKFVDRGSILPLFVAGADGSKLRISVMTSEANLDHSKPAIILMSEVDESGLTRKVVRYELAKDLSSVIRDDMTDDDWAEQELTQIIGYATGVNGVHNKQLEYEMGLNRQPVGREEVEALRELVMSADVSKRPTSS